MNRYAYKTTGLAIKTLSNLSRAKIKIHGQKNIPQNTALIFVINHFTRMETMFLHMVIYPLIKRPIWSLAAEELFKGALIDLLDSFGAVSTKNPDRDTLIIKSLLSGEAAWIIFPEGRMVKNKKLIEKGRFMLSVDDQKLPPRTGAAAMALRCEFYRMRIKHLAKTNPAEAFRLLDLFQLEALKPVINRTTTIVPVNITYYPIRAQENILTALARRLKKNQISKRALEELMAEGTMLLSGVDIDIRFAPPIYVKNYIKNTVIERDVRANHRIDFDDPIPSIGIMREKAVEIMNQYMHAIYDMTTVNFDHLFSGLLRMLPNRTINACDLKRRAYLAASLDFKKMGISVHHSLNEDPLHLMTNDYFHKFKDFINVALEKKLISGKGPDYQRRDWRLSGVLGFHNIRIDNPIAVSANEIEPLSRLILYLKGLAWMPEMAVRWLVARKLYRQMIDEFENDYEEFFSAMESKPMDIGRPRLLRGHRKSVGILLIHGYMAAPAEVLNLGRYLRKQGYWVVIPRIKGHGTSPEDLETRSFKDWRRSVEKGFALINSICDRVVVGGFSTGAGLALDLTARLKSPAGVFAISPPLKLQDFSSHFVPAVDTWNKLMKLMRMDAPKEFIENNPENPHINYLRNPISGIRELERLMDRVEARLENIKAPSLVIQSLRDPVVDPKGSRRIFKSIGGKDKTFVQFNFKRHGILLGRGSLQVYEAVHAFIKRLE